MPEINEIFLESLLYFLSKEKSQRSLASKLGLSPPYLNDLIMKRRNPEDKTKRKIAAALGYPDRYYEDFLNVGRCVLSGENVELDQNREPKHNFMRARGILAINYSKSLILGKDGTLEISAKDSESPVIVYGPSLKRASSENLRAFTFPEKNMEDVIPRNSIVIVDLSMREIAHTEEGQLYLLCPDKITGYCTVKNVYLHENRTKILVTAEDREFSPIYCPISDVIILGKVIMISSYI
jgi:transcriptional regulator with XRE-family HTH domain